MPDLDHTALLLMCTWLCMLQNESFVSNTAAIHYQLRQADIIGHIFLDYLDSSHNVPYLALGMNTFLSLSVQF